MAHLKRKNLSISVLVHVVESCTIDKLGKTEK